MPGACDISALSGGGCELKKPPAGAVMSPWVRVKFKKSGVTITVGNKSSPENNNRAIIKDFEFGHSDGLECRVTIIDESGSSFVKFMEDILKDSKCTVPKGGYTMEVDFGWIMDSCDGGPSLEKNINPYHMMCDNIECNFTGGKFMFQIVGTDIGPRVFEHKVEKVYGDDKNKKHLTDAIREMFTDPDYPPSVSSVKFKRYNEGNTEEPIKFKLKDGGSDEKGPKEVWRGEGLDKINTAMKWMRTYLTTNDKSIIGMFNSEQPDGEIIFWEDFKPNCGQTRNWDTNCLGTYIVNGGKDSPVLEFNPRIRWDFFSLTSTGGNMGEGRPLMNNNGGKNEGRLGCSSLQRTVVPSAGATMSVAVSQDAKNIYSKDAAKETMKGQDQQLKGFRLFHDDIEADLVVVGDPKIMRPSLAIWSKNVKVVFINPYHIFDGADCGEWLAAPLCNEVLSNKAWIVKYITHRISEGKFTTTIGVYLTAPGTVIDVGMPLGGPGSGGWTPPANC